MIFRENKIYFSFYICLAAGLDFRYLTMYYSKKTINTTTYIRHKVTKELEGKIYRRTFNGLEEMIEDLHVKNEAFVQCHRKKYCPSNANDCLFLMCDHLICPRLWARTTDTVFQNFNDRLLV